MWPFKPRTPQVAKPVEPERRRKRKVSDTAIGRAGSQREGSGFNLTPLTELPRVADPFKPATPPKWATDSGMALDSAFEDIFGELNSAAANFGEGIGFMGYGYLAELAQRPEYRRGCEVLAREMTRRWIKFTYTGEEDDLEPQTDGDEEDATKQPPAQPVPGLPPELQPDPAEVAKLQQPAPTADPLDPEQGDPPGIGHNMPPPDAKPKVKPSDEKLKKIEAEFKRLRVRECFRRVAELDGVFGRGHIYVDTGATDKPDELKVPLTLTKAKIGKRALKRLVVVEPTWTYPVGYDSLDPLKKEFFQPQHWLVMQKRVHASRLMTFVGREVPDMLKPAYSFGGLSLIQMVKPYVDNWLRTRQSVSDLLHAFTVWVVSTDLNDVLSGTDDGDQMMRRAELFNRVRDNRGLMMIDKESEEFANVSATLAGLDHLQAQAQEQMAAVFAIPLVVLLGITPSGLNASSDGEIRVFYDFIHAFQEHLFKSKIENLLKMVQLSLFGEIDEDFGFEFLPLWQPTETDQATIRKTNADIDTGYITAGVLDPTEVRERLANDKDSPYANIDPDQPPEDPNALPPGMNPITGEIDEDAAEGDDDFPPSSGGGARAPTVPNPKAGGNPVPPKPSPAGGEAKPVKQGQDAAFNESDHPRGQPGNAGQFGPGGGGSKTETKGSGGEAKSASAKGHGTSNLHEGSRVGFSTKTEGELAGEVVDLTDKFARVKAENGKTYRVPFDQITAGEVQPTGSGSFESARIPLTGLKEIARELPKKLDFMTTNPGRQTVKQVKEGWAESISAMLEHSPDDAPEALIGALESILELAKSSRRDALPEMVRVAKKSVSDFENRERGEHFIAPDKFNAAEYGKTTDDPEVSVESVLSHFPPETGQKIADAMARLRTIEQTHGLFKKDGVYAPERAALHRQILYEGVTKKVLDKDTGELKDRFFPGIISPEKVKAATPAPGERPTFTILGGRGGSGKSKLEGVAYDPSKALVLNSDDIKERLPEYEGWNAAQVHEESDELMKVVDAFAKTMGLNIVHDVTMKSPDKALATVQDYKDRGYRVEAHYMHVPRQEAAKRAIGRFLGKTNRLVSPEIILGNTRNEEAFELVKPLADKWSFRDNTEGGGPGTPAKLISEGGN